MIDQAYYFKKYNSPGTFILPSGPLTIDSQESASAGHNIANANSLTYSFNNVAGTLLLVGVVATDLSSGSTPTITGVTYNGTSMTIVDVTNGVQSWSTNHSQEKLFYLLNPSLSSNNVVVSVTFGGGTPSAQRDIFAGAISFINNHPTTPIVQTVLGNNGGSTNNHTINVTGTTSGNYVVGVCGSGDAVTSTTAPTTLSASKNIDNATAGNNMGLSQQSTSGGTAAVRFNTATADWIAIVAAEIAKAP